MANFDADTLDELRQLQEVAIRTEKHPGTAVVIWAVVADDEVFVRSVRGSQGALVPGPRGGRTRHARVRRPPAGGAGDPGDRPRCGRPGQPRIPEEVPAEPLCAGDGAARSPADHAAARTALTGRSRAGSSRSPSRSSSTRIVWLSADCEAPSCAAALVTLRSSPQRELPCVATAEGQDVVDVWRGIHESIS